MTHARTLTRYACLAGLVAGLLAPVQSLAQTPSYNSSNARATITNVKGTSRVTLDDVIIQTEYRARHSNLPGAVTRYTSGTVMVPASTYRTAALSALGRGVMHPGLQLAVAAAGFVWSQQDGIQVSEPSIDDIVASSGSFSGGYSSAYSACVNAGPNPFNPGDPSNYYVQRVEWDTATRVDCVWYRSRITGDTYQNRTSISYFPNNAPTQTNLDIPTTYRELDDSDYEEIDANIPETIVQDLWSDSQASQEWEQIISDFWASTPGSSNVDAQGQAAPELYPRVREDNENLYADLAGEPRPNPDTETEGRTASEQMYEETQETPPDFPGVEPEWQVEEIDSLPDFDMGLGSGTCPAPTVINLPAPMNSSVTLEWQPFCDFAGMIRGAVIAISMILSLFIVLRK